MKGDAKIKNKKAHDYEFIALTYHEAGHAIVNLCHSFNVSNVKVSKSKLEGYTSSYTFNQFNMEDPALKKTLITNEIESLYAGFVCEKIYYNDICGSNSFPRILKMGSESDIKSAYNLMNDFGLARPGKSRFRLKKKLEKNVQKILLDNWQEVKLLAHYLYKFKRLNSRELEDLLLNNSKNVSAWRERYKKLHLIWDSPEGFNEDQYKLLLTTK